MSEYFNHKEKAIIKYLYQINRFAPAYEIAQEVNISLPTAQKYLAGNLSELVEQRIRNKYEVKVNGKKEKRIIYEYRLKIEILRPYIKKEKK